MGDLAGLTGELAQAREAVAGRMRGVDPNDYAAMRQAYDAFSENDPMPDGAAQSEIELGGVRCLGVLPRGGSGDHVIFWLHGGGYAMGSSRSHKGMASHVAAAAAAAAVVVDYRLAPEHPFPAAVEDAVAAYKAVLGEGVQASRIVLAGDSAGGGLAVATALKLKEDGVELPAGLALLSPWVNLGNTGWSWEAKAGRDPFLTKSGLDVRAAAYLNGAYANGLADHPFLDPLSADLRGLPPTLIQVGEAEVLLSDSTALAERLGAAGAPVTLEIWPDMFHVFQARYIMLSSARQALERIGAWSAAHFR